jgi:Cu+-exporting ATPase
VNAGAGIPCDGMIIDGHTYCDESMLTGESNPVYKIIGNSVIGGTINQTGSILIKVMKTGSDTTLARIINLVQDAQASRAPIQEFADKISSVFVPGVLFLALLTFGTWILIANMGWIELPRNKTYMAIAIEHAVDVLVIACPCALGLATPTAVMVGTGVAAKMGILIKGGGAALEMSHRVTTVVFDKTGTLTVGKPSITDTLISILPPGLNETILWDIVTKIESHSDHPLAQAICHFFKPSAPEGVLIDHLSNYSISEISETAGHGLSAKVTFNGKHKVFIGNEKWMKANNISINTVNENAIENWTKLGKSIVLVGFHSSNGNYLAGLIGIADQLRSESSFVVSKLQERGIDVWMITGDHDSTARNVGSQIGILSDRILSQVLPEEKYKRIIELQNQPNRYGKKQIVAMVGDGINDSVAIAQANVGYYITNVELLLVQDQI